MSRRPLISLLVALLLTGALALPTSAGGWATVETDEDLGSVEAGQTVTIGFMLLQHGVTPYEGGEPVLTATHRDNGETVSADGLPEGKPGHYIAEVTFPDAGEWVSTISHGPFGGSTSLPTLTVVAPGQLGANDGLAEDDDTHGAAIVGGCGTTSDLQYDLGDLIRTPSDTTNETDAPAIERGRTVLPIALTDLLRNPGAITVDSGAAGSNALACGSLIGQPVDGELIVGLSEHNASGYVGFARITEEDGQTVVNLYLSAGLTGGPAAPTADITISGYAFGPASLTIAAGTTVTWTNADPIKHEIAFADIQLDNSGLLDSGQTFSETFTTPGTYSYICGPHSGMKGTIIVT